MKRYRIAFTERALRHFQDIGGYLKEKAGSKIAMRYVAHLQRRCHDLKTAPMRGRKADDISPGLRIIAFRKSVNIAFSIDGNTVIIHGIFYGGQDIVADAVEEN